MAKGTATVVKISPDGRRIKFEVKLEGVTDELVVDFSKESIGKQQILGLEHLFGCEIGDDFFVTGETIPPRTSTLTHIQVTAFDGPARERPAPG